MRPRRGSARRGRRRRTCARDVHAPTGPSQRVTSSTAARARTRDPPRRAGHCRSGRRRARAPPAHRPRPAAWGARPPPAPPGSHGSPASASAAPPASRAATGAKMSRPWKVAATSGSANGERPMSTASTTPPARSAASDSKPLSGPTSNRPSPARRATPRRSPPTPGSTTARWTPTGRYGSAPARIIAPARTSWRGTRWTRSITRASGQIPAITAWQTPTKSSSSP